MRIVRFGRGTANPWRSPDTFRLVCVLIPNACVLLRDNDTVKGVKQTMCIKVRIAILAVALAIAALFSTATAQAQLLVTAQVNEISVGTFQYDYTVTNNTGQDIYLIDIGTAQDPLAVQNLTVPAGFESAFDPGLGLVTFLENTSTFGPTPTSGFEFDSPFGPGATFFDGDYIDLNFNNQVISGSTVGPVATPEPENVAMLIALAASGTLFIARRLCNLS